MPPGPKEGRTSQDLCNPHSSANKGSRQPRPRPICHGQAFAQTMPTILAVPGCQSLFKTRGGWFKDAGYGSSRSAPSVRVRYAFGGLRLWFMPTECICKTFYCHLLLKLDFTRNHQKLAWTPCMHHPCHFRISTFVLWGKVITLMTSRASGQVYCTPFTSFAASLPIAKGLHVLHLLKALAYKRSCYDSSDVGSSAHSCSWCTLNKITVGVPLPLYLLYSSCVKFLSYWLYVHVTT